MLPIIAHKN